MLGSTYRRHRGITALTPVSHIYSCVRTISCRLIITILFVYTSVHILFWSCYSNHAHCRSFLLTPVPNGILTGITCITKLLTVSAKSILLISKSIDTKIKLRQAGLHVQAWLSLEVLNYSEGYVQNNMFTLVNQCVYLFSWNVKIP